MYTRFRERKGLTHGIVKKYSNAPSGLHPYNGVFAEVANVRGTQSSIWDNKFANYRKRKNAGEILMGDMSISSTEIQSSDGEFTLGPYDDWGISRLRGPLAAMGSGRVERGEFDKLGQASAGRAINAALAKMNSTPLLAGEICADFKSTLSMLRKPVRAAADLVETMLGYRKMLLKRKTSGSVHEASAKAWLEYRYGWSPIVKDADVVIEQMAKTRSNSLRTRHVARASDSWSWQGQQEFGKADFGDWPNLVSRGFAFAKGGGKASAGVLFEVVEPQSAVEKANAALGTRLSDIPRTLWETLPYSFVYDWAVGIGSWIAAITPNPGIAILGTWCTRVAEFESSCEPEFYYPGINFHPPTIKKVGSYKIIERYVIRDCGVSATNLPVVRGINLSALQTADAVSLLVTNFGNNLQKLRH